MKLRLALTIFAVLTISPQMMHSQVAAATIPPALTVATVIDAVNESVNRIVEVAFDRLDLTLLKAAMEARATINAARMQFGDATTASINELDDQQRRLISDLQTLNDAINENLTKVVQEFNAGTNQALTDVRLLLSDNPGAVYVSAKPAVVGDGFVDIEISGTALSNAQLRDLRVSAIALTPQIMHADDRRIEYRVNLDDLVEGGAFDPDVKEPVALPVTFSLVEESWFPWFSSMRGPFFVAAVILPKRLGEVRAVFATNVQSQERRQQQRGPFVSERVKTKLVLSWKKVGVKIGERWDTWMASPSEGWRIDIATAKFDFQLLFDNCWSRRSEASWTEQTEQILRVRAHTMAERLLGKTCKSSTTISYEEWRPLEVTGESVTDFQPILADQTVILRLPENPTKARLSHVEIRSPLFDDESKIFHIKDLPNNFSGRYDQATQTVFFTLSYLRGK